MTIKTVTLKQANEYVAKLHRHHKPVQGHKFSIGLFNPELCGVIICGRPVARAVDQVNVLEVTRLCTDGTKNACSKLYAAAAKSAKELGYGMIQTYILESESGVSLKASGWKLERYVQGRSWSCKSRPRVDKHPTVNKSLWIKKF